MKRMIVIPDIPLDEMVGRLTASGSSEDQAKEIAETNSVVFKLHMDEPVSRRYVDIHLRLLETRLERRLERMEARIVERLRT